MNYVIDGLFLTQKITGIQRFALEICKELDKTVQKSEIELLVPNKCNPCLSFENIKIIRFGNHSGRLWEQIDLKRYLVKNKKDGIFLTNELPLTYRKGIICIHDIGYKVNPSFFKSKKERLSALWHRMHYFAAAKSNMKILTVSDFSKAEIERVYNVDENRIFVIKNSWQHMGDIRENDETFEKFPFLEKNNYFFYMSTLAENKNFSWVLHAAKNNPNYVFAVAGYGKQKAFAETEGFSDMPNIHFLGYLSDDDAKTLMHYCKAFLFPTLYEGFGMPPLEAVACGCKNIIISDIPVMHEIYGDYANYINPFEYDNNEIDCINGKKNIRSLLDNYSWKDSAEKLYKILKKQEKS